MNPLQTILSQPLAHLACYSLTLAILFAAVHQAWLLQGLKARLCFERGRLQEGEQPRSLLEQMVHPTAKGLLRLAAAPHAVSPETLLRAVDLAEHVLFTPLRHAMSLTRDVSTLMGLVSTCVGLVTAAAEFVKHGQPQLMVGSVGTAAIGTIIAGVGCMVSLWNLSRLANLRLAIAQESDQLLLEPFEGQNKPTITVCPSDPVPASDLPSASIEKEAYEPV